MSDPVSPGHYQFGDTQLISVTRHLTSNGGQAVQYIARATRTDDANKSSDDAGRLEDLLKARVFLDDEIALLRGSETHLRAEGLPRVWGSLFDVPAGVRVEHSGSGVSQAVIKEKGSSYYWVGDFEEDVYSMDSGSLRGCAPFTEVLS